MPRFRFILILPLLLLWPVAAASPLLVTVGEVTEESAVIWGRGFEAGPLTAGPTEPLMPAGRQAFLDYWPVRPPTEEPGQLYRRVRWGKLLDLFILDTRQYRSDNRQPDGPGGR